MPEKLNVPDVLDRFRAYREQSGHSEWGSLHVVPADANYKDSNVEFCRTYALEQGDTEGAELAAILLRMTKTQRGRLSRLA